MVHLTRLDGTSFTINSDLIERLEETPETVVTLTNGHHFTVRERADAIVRGIVDFRRSIVHPDDLYVHTHRRELRG